MNNKKANYKSFLPIGVAIAAVGAVFMTSVNPPVGLGLLGVGIMFVIVSVSRKDGGGPDEHGRRDSSD